MAEEQKQSKTERSKHRSITKRIVVTGYLELTRPAHFGNGDAAELTDMPLLVDEPLFTDDADLSGVAHTRAMIPGASLAGALRNYLREREWGYEMLSPPRDPQHRHYFEWSGTENDLLAAELFGGYRGVPDGDQSPLIVEDAFSEKTGLPEVELRDGVKLEARTRTAEEKKKYDYQLLPAGTRFKLIFELLLDDEPDKNTRRLKALAIVLRGLGGRKLADGSIQDGEIRLGARKRRGFGCCRVANWEVTVYDLIKPGGVFGWLAADYQDKDGWKLEHQPEKSSGDNIFELLGVAESEAGADRRDDFEIEASFEIDCSLMIRSGFSNQHLGPDTIHLQTKSGKNGDLTPTLSGTSVAGAIRNRALRIANTLTGDGSGVALNLVNSMFGPEKIGFGDEPFASRVRVNEEFIKGGHSLVQTRIKIDRFTGGTIESALLEEAPQFGGTVTLQISLRNPEDGEIGLLLLVLKDLWLGDLPLGGESSVGRGRLCGIWASIRRSGQNKILMTRNSNGRIKLSDENAAQRLEACVAALNQHLVERK